MDHICDLAYSKIFAILQFFLQSYMILVQQVMYDGIEDNNI